MLIVEDEPYRRAGVHPFGLGPGQGRYAAAAAAPAPGVSDGAPSAFP